MVQTTTARLEKSNIHDQTGTAVWSLVLRSIGAFAAALALIFVVGGILRQPLINRAGSEIMRTEYAFNAAELPANDSALEGMLRSNTDFRNVHIERAGSRVTVAIDHPMGSYVLLNKSSLFRLGYLTDSAPEERMRNLSAEKRAAQDGLQDFASSIPFSLAIPLSLIVVTGYLWVRRARNGESIRDLFTRLSWRRSIVQAVVAGGVCGLVSWVMMIVSYAGFDAKSLAALANAPKLPLWVTAWFTFTAVASTAAQCVFLYGAIQEPFRRAGHKTAGILTAALIASVFYPLAHMSLGGAFYAGYFSIIGTLSGVVIGVALAVLYQRQGDLKVPLLGTAGANLVAAGLRFF